MEYATWYVLQAGLEASLLEECLLLVLDPASPLNESRNAFKLALSNLLDMHGIGTLFTHE